MQRIVRLGLAGLLGGMAFAAMAQEPILPAPQQRPENPDQAPEPSPMDIAIEAMTMPEHRVGPVTGYAIPRFVSLDASTGNARRGPSRSHRIDWVFQRRNMPMMVVAEHGHWRRVVDRDGAGGWMHYALLSGVRSAIVESDLVELRHRPSPDGTPRAQVERGVIGRLSECQIDWCLMEVGGYSGWVPKSAIWGVEAEEVFE
mgnify:CR=1 FL=1